MASKKTILDAMKVLGLQFSQGRLNMTDEQISLEAMLWLDEFQNVDDSAFNAAVRTHIRTGTWFPRIAEIYEHLNKFEDMAEGGDDWQQGWSSIKGAISRIGAWGTMDETDEYFKNRLPPAMADDVSMIVRRFGWREFCNMPIDQEMAWRAQFRDAYQRLRTSRIERRRMHPDTAKLIADIAQKFAAERARLQAPKRDELNDSGEENYF